MVPHHLLRKLDLMLNAISQLTLCYERMINEDDIYPDCRALRKDILHRRAHVSRLQMGVTFLGREIQLASFH